MAAAPLLQIRTMVRRRSSADVSVGYLSVLLVGFLLWVAYGISLPNLALVVSNTAAFIANVATIVVAMRFRSLDRPQRT
jgi:uncharacterized protein with PQ loop repeat